VVITNESKRPRGPFRVSGTVASPLSISPQAIALGALKPGQPVKKVLVLKGTSPFRIESIDCPGWDVDFEKSEAQKSTHIVQATFTPSEARGPQKVTVAITTAGKDSVTAKAILTADVRQQ